MRINESTNKQGYFWLASSPDRKLPGTLTITDGGYIYLETLGLFEQDIENLKAINEGKNEIGRVVGVIDTNTLITLDECHYKDRNIALGGGFSKATIYAYKAFTGVAYDDSEKVVFNRIRFSIEGLDEWVNITGIKVKYSNNLKDNTIQYSLPDSIEVYNDNQIKLSIVFSVLPPKLPATREATISQKVFFNIEAKEEIPFDDFIWIMYKITNLLAFAIDQTVCLEQVTAFSNNICVDLNDSKSYPSPITTYYRSSPFVKVSADVKRNKMLFNFSDVQEDIGTIFNNWFRAYDEIEPSLKLYFRTQLGELRYVEGDFLALTQGLESYHRRTSDEILMGQEEFEELTNQLIEACPPIHKDWLIARIRYGNELSLRKRLKKLIEPYKEYFVKNRQEANGLISEIVDTRNYLTHYDKSQEDKVKIGLDLWPLYCKTEVIFQLHMLQILGFTTEQIKTFFQSSSSLQRKLKA